MNEFDNELLYQDFVRSENALTASYSVAYRIWKWKEVVLEETLREVSRRPGSLRILDVGCDRGRDLFNLAAVLGPDIPHEYVGLDFVASTIRFCLERARREKRARFEFVQASCEKMPFDGASFDLVWAQEIVEHLPDPSICIKELHRVLKPGGLAILTTPNGWNTIREALRFLRGKPPTPPVEDLPMTTVEPGLAVYAHISVWPWQRWAKTAEAAGFRVEKIRRCAALYGGGREDGHRLLFAGLLALDWLLDRLPGTASFCEQFAIVLRKPA